MLEIDIYATVYTFLIWDRRFQTPINHENVTVRTDVRALS